MQDCSIGNPVVPNVDAWIAMLNELGHEGWEAVGPIHTWETPLQPYLSTVRLLLKRKLQ